MAPLFTPHSHIQIPSTYEPHSHDTQRWSAGHFNARLRPPRRVAVAAFTGNKCSVNCLRLPQKLLKNTRNPSYKQRGIPEAKDTEFAAAPASTMRWQSEWPHMACPLPRAAKQCPRSARTVPAQCPHSARDSARLEKCIVLAHGAQTTKRMFMKKKSNF